MSYGWVFGVIGLTIFLGFVVAAWFAERDSHKPWWREEKNEEWRRRW